MNVRSAAINVPDSRTLDRNKRQLKAPDSSNDPDKSLKKLPGDLAMWMFIGMELTVFALFFFGFAVMQRLNPELFSAGKSTVHPVAGLLCTLALITSSYFVALALMSIRRQRQSCAAKMLVLALLSAALYMFTKVWEYAQLIEAGYKLSTNTFYTLYFFTTFFHFMHVLLGMVILSYIAIKTRKGGYAVSSYGGFEAGACYWHMVDLVWIILFPLIYVIH